jgi:Family of unknown function (DUF5317)
MFILYAIIVAIVIGLASGGRLSGLSQIRIRWAPLILLALLAQVALFSDAVASRVGDFGPLLYVGSTLMVGAAVARNLDVPGFALVAVGALSNMAAILANGGYMPASPGALAVLDKHAPTIYSNSSVVAQPALEPLTDLFALPIWVPFANVFSIGDVLLAIGLVFVIVAAMRTALRDPGPVRRLA